MLIVAGHFEVEPERRDDFIAEREESMRKSRAEPGCISYGMMADPLEPGRVVLFERWESKEALADHLTAARSAPRPPSDIKVLAAEVNQFEVTKMGDLGS
jgi:quinol monooxygenase YgiN